MAMHDHLKNKNTMQEKSKHNSVYISSIIFRNNGYGIFSLPKIQAKENVLFINGYALAFEK